MTCTICCDVKKRNTNPKDCIDIALDTLKRHFTALQNDAAKAATRISLLEQRNADLAKALKNSKSAIDKDDQIKLLQEHNDKLTKAVILLQRLNPSADQPTKRRKTIIEPTESLDISSDEMPEDDENDCLNTALNDEDLMDTSNISNFAQHSNTQTQKVALHEKNANEMASSPPIENASKQKWYTKPQDKSLLTWCNKGNKKQKSFLDMMRAEPLAPPPSPKMKTNVKTPQRSNKRASLSLSAKRTPNEAGTYNKRLNLPKETEEMIAASPNPHTSLQKMKSSRSMLRVSNNDNDRDIIEGVEMKPTFDDCDDLNNFLIATNSNNTSNLNQTNAFDIRPDDTIIQHNNDALKLTPSSESSSVVILTPQTQEIIFLDDTNIDSTNIMQQFLLDDNDEDFFNLKRIELENIQNLQEKAQKIINYEPVKSANNIKDNDKPTTSKLAQDDENYSNNIKVKIEKKSQIDENKSNLNTTKNSKKMFDENLTPTQLNDESLIEEKKYEADNHLNDTPSLSTIQTFNQNMKKEKCVENEDIDNDETFVAEEWDKITDDELQSPIKIEKESRNNRINIKERYNINCIECQKYIDFMADRLTEEEIEQHLQNCVRHKKRDFLISETPEGFWNPLMESFAADDPRNEVIIDTRKPNIKYKYK